MIEPMQVRRVARSMDVDMHCGGERLLADFLNLVSGPGSGIRVVSDPDPDLLLRRHLADSLAGIGEIEALAADATISLVDVGSGGGFPGMVLALARPQWIVHLVESGRKRAGFLLKVIAELGIRNARVIPERSERSGVTGDFVVARGVAPLPELLPMLIPVANPGGHLILWKGPDAAAEMKDAEPMMSTAGLKVVRRRTYRLPKESITREILVIEFSPAEGSGGHLQNKRPGEAEI